jgi:hypothetical protein
MISLDNCDIQAAKVENASSMTVPESHPPTTPTARDRLWTEFYHAKVHACYLNLLLRRTSVVNTGINVTTAVLGCGAVASFIRTSDFNVAAIFAALAGALATAKPYLPYKQRMRALGAAAHEYEEHLRWVEKRWPEVDEGKLDATEFRNELQRKTENTEHKHFPETHVPDVPKLMAQAQKHALAHFKAFYGSDIQ